MYPAAVVEIAKSFIFKNVGGTSAGAIAALTAAAERRRAADGSTAGFDRLGTVPDWLATDDPDTGHAASPRTEQSFIAY